MERQLAKSQDMEASSEPVGLHMPFTLNGQKLSLKGHLQIIQEDLFKKIHKVARDDLMKALDATQQMSVN